MEIEDITDEEILYKNSLSYISNDWRTKDKLTVKYPVHRKLTKGECVLDIDGASDIVITVIPEFLKQDGLKFKAYQTSDFGCHIHFWTDVYGKHQKIALVKLIGARIKQLFGVSIDYLPMGHGFIRAEDSFHPKKGYQKKLIVDNIPYLDPINKIPDTIKSKLPKGENLLRKGVTGNDKGNLPKCVRYMMSHKFSDGRERIIFSLISWFKSSGKTDNEVMSIINDWCKRQEYYMSNNEIYCKVKSNQGTVGCNFRHRLLEELGYDIGECKGL